MSKQPKKLSQEFNRKIRDIIKQESNCDGIAEELREYVENQEDVAELDDQNKLLLCAIFSDDEIKNKAAITLRNHIKYYLDNTNDLDLIILASATCDLYKELGSDKTKTFQDKISNIDDKITNQLIESGRTSAIVKKDDSDQASMWSFAEYQVTKLPINDAPKVPNEELYGDNSSDQQQIWSWPRKQNAEESKTVKPLKGILKKDLQNFGQEIRNTKTEQDLIAFGGVMLDVGRGRDVTSQSSSSSQSSLDDLEFYDAQDIGLMPNQRPSASPTKVTKVSKSSKPIDQSQSF